MSDPDTKTERYGFDREDGSCLACDGHAVTRQGQYGPFLGCTNFPRCHNAASMPRQSFVAFPSSPDDVDRAEAEAFYEGDGR